MCKNEIKIWTWIKYKWLQASGGEDLVNINFEIITWLLEGKLSEIHSEVK